MNSKYLLRLTLIALTLLGCSKESGFPVDKRYWDSKDYGDVILKISYGTPDGEEYPRFSNPETSIVIQKLLDAENYKVIIGDSELGLNYRNEEAQKFFNHSPDSEKIQDIIKSNETTVVKNFNVFLDQVNNERAYGEYASLLAGGINENFPKLIKSFPNANYSSMKAKAELMLKKAQNEELKAALVSLIEQLKELPG